MTEAAPAPTQTNPGIIVGYWGIRGLGAPLRMMIMFRGLPLICENYDCGEENGVFDTSSWFNVKEKYKAKNPLINLPYVQVGDLVVTQSNACILYLGRRLNLMGNDDYDQVEVEELLCEYMDLRTKISSYVYRTSATPPLTWLTQLVASGSGIHKLHDFLVLKYPTSTEENLYFVAKQATAADFALWEVIDVLKSMATFFQSEEDIFNDYPLLNLFHRRFKELPENKRYFQSHLSRLPVNNLSAKVFGATPSGAAYVSGDPRPWNESSGVYQPSSPDPEPATAPSPVDEKVEQTKPPAPPAAPAPDDA
eukprot:gene1867-2043_t